MTTPEPSRTPEPQAPAQPVSPGRPARRLPRLLGIPTTAAVGVAAIAVTIVIGLTDTLQATTPTPVVDIQLPASSDADGDGGARLSRDHADRFEAPGDGRSESLGPDASNSAFTTTALVGDLSPDRMPQRLVIDAIGVDAPVDAVGIDELGRMEIPASGRRVGWYARGAIPGDPGTAVLSGHVDTAAEGPGALFNLRRLTVGDEITIVDGSGTATTWKVVATDQQAKADLPHHQLFDDIGPPRIAVVTCAGRFDRATRTYDDNLIVWAQPA